MKEQPILQVNNLQTVFNTDKGKIRAVDGVSFAVPKGKTMGIVGESGSGKSITALSILQLLATNSNIKRGRAYDIVKSCFYCWSTN